MTPPDQTARVAVPARGPVAPDMAALFDGSVSQTEFHAGFGVHTLNATARRRFEIDTMRKPGVILHCFLEGHTEARLDGADLDLGRREGGRARMVLTRADEPLRFWRLSRAGEYVRKVNITVSFDWLEAAGLGTCPCPPRVEWTLGDSAVQRFERLLQLGAETTPLARLESESIALAVVVDALHQLSDQTDATALSPTDQRRMARMEAFIRDSDGQRPSLREIAEAGHVSVSTMRRLFAAAHALSVHGYVRKVRLEAARHALAERHVPVAEAARIAGYTSPANFSTAFRRAYGMAPANIRLGTV